MTDGKYLEGIVPKVDETLLKLAPQERAWAPMANCRDADPKLFDGEQYRPGGPRSYTKAAKICAECIVKKDCLEDALSIAPVMAPEHGLRFYMFQAGLTPKELQAEFKKVAA